MTVETELFPMDFRWCLGLLGEWRRRRFDAALRTVSVWTPRGKVVAEHAICADKHTHTHTHKHIIGHHAISHDRAVSIWS